MTAAAACLGGWLVELEGVLEEVSSTAPALAPLVAGSDERRAFDVEVPGYAAGRLEFVTL